MLELLRTKLFIPRPRPDLVLRPRLSERLNSGLRGKLTLIAAPAGFGKTTLLSEWITQSPRCVTWLSLDEGDNDPVRFWAYVIASLQRVQPELGASAAELLQSPQAPPLISVITSLINDIAAFPDAFSVVLEDYHLIDGQPIHTGLAYLIDHLPENLHLTITTRVDPPLPLARLRALNQLTELRSNDLRFTTGETAAFVDKVTGLKLSAAEIAALDVRIEGWIAGLQIAALSMQGRNDLSGFIQSFSGSHRHIVGYLAEEVLNQRPRGTLSFLLQTSILDRLCGPLCDAVTGEIGGQATLEKLEQANLFITPLDDAGVWYRYHQLFAEVLQARLQRTWPDRVGELHRRAATWHASQGVPAEAVRHALAGADFEEAARLIEDMAGAMLRQGASVSLIRWLDAIPEGLVRLRPRLCLDRAWTFHWGPVLDLNNAEKWAALAAQAALASGSVDPALAGEITAIHALAAATRSEVARSLELSLQALDDLPLDSPWRSVMALTLGTAFLDSGDVLAALSALEEALQLSQANGSHYVQLVAACFLADIQVYQGHLSRAKEAYGNVLEWSNPDFPQKGDVMAQGGLAGILCERGQLDAALAHINAGMELVDRVGGAWPAHLLYRVLARVQCARGQWQDALDTLERSYRTGQGAQVRLVMTQAAALRARVHMAQSDFSAASEWAASCGLDPDDPEADHPGWREAEYLSLARVVNAQGRPTEALRLLDRLLQSAQSETRAGSAIAILILQALVMDAQGNGPVAHRCLEHALALAEPEGYVRVFVDEGEPMRTLLAREQAMMRQRLAAGQAGGSRRLLDYTNSLLAAFSQAANTVNPQNLSEPLSERELEILRLIAEGLSNKEIADFLVVAVSTVKSHINAIYGKLGTHRRTQAIAVARGLGLLAD